MPVIEMMNLTKNYSKARGIVDLNLNIEEGEFFGFIGPNGAGKSTTIRTLLGLIAPTSGSAAVFGKPVSHAAAYLSDVGYMPSEASGRIDFFFCKNAKKRLRGGGKTTL